MKKTHIISAIVFSLSILFSCTKKSNSNDPIIGTGSSADLAGSKWTIYQYKDASMSNPQVRTDTLIFTDATHYTFNHNAYTYYLNTGDYTHLTLHSTPFGDIDGTVPNNFIQNGEIIGVPFSQLKASGALTYYLWMKKF